MKKTYWRSVDDLTGSPEFRDWMHREFPDGASEHVPSDDRRTFLKVMGASFALAGLGVAGCRRWPETKIVPAASQPANRIPGVPVTYCSSWDFAGFGQPLLVKSYDGRPIKLDTNPAHPWGGAGISAVAQAQVLSLYDPERSRQVMSKGVASSYEPFVTFLANTSRELKQKGGQGLAILCGAASGPTHAATIARVRAAFPKATIVEWESLGRDNVIVGTEAAFGAPMRVIPAFDKAKVIVSLGDDFLYGSPDAPQWAKRWAVGRSIDAADPKAQEVARLYVIEQGLTSTGMCADERIATRLASMHVAASIIAEAVGVGSGSAELRAALTAANSSAAATALREGRGQKVFDALVTDLKANRGRSVVTAGATACEATHALVAAINRALGNEGSTVTLHAEMQTASMSSLQALCKSMESGEVDTLFILGANPVYSAPVDCDFGGALKKVATVVHLGLHADETARHAGITWHIPQAHFLECWSDTRSFDGTIAVQQPLILPMLAQGQGGRSVDELLAELVGDGPADAESLVKSTHESLASASAGGPVFAEIWRKTLDRGFVEGSALPAVTAPPMRDAEIAKTLTGCAWECDSAKGVEVVFLRDMKVWDGRFGCISWMQELPDPVTKITWDNALLMSPKTADDLKLKRGQMAAVTVQGRTLEAVAWPVPGWSDGSVGISLGYGRSGAGVGLVASDAGFNANRIRTAGAPDWTTATAIAATGATYSVAHTQDHGAADALNTSVPMQGIQERLPTLVREATLDEYRSHPDFARHRTHVASRLSLWSENNLEGAQFRWAMAVDLSKCTGCSACVTACQAENNIPVVGKDMVLRGREMFWIRIDRYFKGTNAASPEGFALQPVACMHCENAPCEQVCPVAATVHDQDGLNSMVYNRCIGTRYCSNNCPYKVRRFNFFDYHRRELSREEGIAKVKPEYYIEEGPDVWLRMQFNPEVTVRMRGVMEKCTFCTQRIQAARIKAKNDWARAGGTASGQKQFSIPDGTIQTACQQACPTGAITFGDLNVADSAVSKLHRSNRSYQMLEELNTKTRLQYLARVTNPALPRESGSGYGGHGSGHGSDHGSGHGSDHGSGHGNGNTKG